MAVVNTVSTELTNVEADPIVMNDIRNIHGRLRIKSAAVTVANGDSDTSTFRFFRVRSSDSIKSLQLRISQVFTSGTDFDCGLYTIDTGAAVDSDLYADGFVLDTTVPVIPHAVAAAPYQELRFADSVTAIMSDINNAVFEDLGLSADPQLEYDVVILANTIGSQGGILSLTMYYTAGD